MVKTNSNFVGLWVRVSGQKGFKMYFDVTSTRLVTQIAKQIAKRPNVLAVSMFRLSGWKHDFKIG